MKVGFPYLWILLLSTSLLAQTNPVALKGATLVTVTGATIDNGVLLMDSGKIAAIGAKISIPDNATVIDVSGKWVLPGLIDGFTNLGVADLPSFGSDDDEATSAVTPHLRVIDAINPDNAFISLARRSGVTAALAAPGEGNLLSGQSALIRLAGSTVDDMTIRFPVGVHAVLGEAPKSRYGKKGTAPMTRMGTAALLRQSLVDAGQYADKLVRYEENKADEKEDLVRPERDMKLEALVPVVRGDLPLLVSANRFDDILTALRIAEEFDLRLVLIHGAETHRVADKLAAKQIPVVFGPTYSHHTKEETLGATLEGPALLNQAGVEIAFQTGSIANVSNLLDQARSAVTHGLPYEEALHALTLYPAQLFGVVDELGSLEVGKSADLVVFDADPLRDLARVETVFIRGELFEVGAKP
jgi:imidazolonepropionase-like amidohydrolase